MLFGWVWADAAVSILVALLIVRSGYAVVKNAAHILMEGAQSYWPKRYYQNPLPTQTCYRFMIYMFGRLPAAYIVYLVISLSQARLPLQQTDALLSELQHELQHLGHWAQHHSIWKWFACARLAQFNCDITSAPLSMRTRTNRLLTRS